MFIGKTQETKSVMERQTAIEAVQEWAYAVMSHPPQDHLACGLSVCLQKASGRRFKSRFFGT